MLLPLTLAISLISSAHQSYAYLDMLKVSTSGNLVASRTNRGLYLFSRDGMVKARLLPVSIDAACFEFSRDSRRLGASLHNGGAAVWDVATGEELLHYKTTDGIFGNGCSITADGSKIAVGNDNGRIGIWDVATKQLVGVMPFAEESKEWFHRTTHTDQGDRSVMTNDYECEQVCFSPDGAYLAAASQSTHYIRIWDANRLHLARELPVSLFAHMTWCSNSRTLIDLTGVRAWDVVKGEGILFEPDTRNVFGNRPRVHFPMGAITEADDLVLLDQAKGILYRCQYGEKQLTTVGPLEDWPQSSFRNHYTFFDSLGHFVVCQDRDTGHIGVWSTANARLVWRVQ